MTTTIIELPDNLHAQVQELAHTTGRPVTELLTDCNGHTWLAGQLRQRGITVEPLDNTFRL